MMIMRDDGDDDDGDDGDDDDGDDNGDDDNDDMLTLVIIIISKEYLDIKSLSSFILRSFKHANPSDIINS